MVRSLKRTIRAWGGSGAGFALPAPLLFESGPSLKMAGFRSRYAIHCKPSASITGHFLNCFILMASKDGITFVQFQQ